MSVEQKVSLYFTSIKINILIIYTSVSQPGGHKTLNKRLHWSETVQR